MKASRIFLLPILFSLLIPIPSWAINLGPYTGKVVDRQTGTPIEGASVLFYWTKSVPTMWKSYSELIAAKLAYTDSRGQYTIPRVSTNMGLSSVLEETIVIIYEPGYQAYIQWINHISPERKTDRPLQEKNNPVNLERIPPYFNYSDHYSGIDRAMGGLREPPMVYPHEVGSKMPWSKIMETQLKFLPEREEFLRRIEWERRRPVEERR